MKIAQVCPLAESVPPKLYGGTERIAAYLSDELAALGHDVTLFASGDSATRGKLEAVWPRALRLDDAIRDPLAPHMLMLERVARRRTNHKPSVAQKDRGGRGAFLGREHRVAGRPDN